MWLTKATNYNCFRYEELRICLCDFQSKDPDDAAIVSARTRMYTLTAELLTNVSLQCHTRVRVS